MRSQLGPVGRKQERHGVTDVAFDRTVDHQPHQQEEEQRHEIGRRLLDTRAYAARDDVECEAHEEEVDHDQQQRIGEHVAKALLDLLAALACQRAAQRIAFHDGLDEIHAHHADVIEHPACNHRIEGHDEESRQRADGAEHRPAGARLRLRRDAADRPDRIGLADASDEDLGQHERQAEQEHTGDIEDNERAAAAFSGQRREAPDIAEPHCGSDRSKNESGPRRPALTRRNRRGDHIVLFPLQQRRPPAARNLRVLKHTNSRNSKLRFALVHALASGIAMSTTFQLDTSTSRANPTPKPMKRLTVPKIRAHKANGETGEPLVMLTAYTARQAQLLDAHCDILLVGDSLAQVIYGLPTTIPVTLDMMANHAAAVVRGSFHSVVVVDMPFGSYEQSPQQAFESATYLLKQSGAAAVKLEGGEQMAETVAFLNQRGIPVMGHVGLTPQAVNVLGGYAARGRSDAEAKKIVGDARALDDAGAFAIVLEGVLEPIAIEATGAVSCPTIGIGASAQCDGQVLVTEDMLGMFDRVPRFVKKYEDIAAVIEKTVAQYAEEVRARSFPTPDQTYQPKG